MACLLSFRPNHPQCRLLILHNRDEATATPTVLPHVWMDNPDIAAVGVLAAKDLTHSNTATSLGVTRRGRFAVMTMVRTAADKLALQATTQATPDDVQSPTQTSYGAAPSIKSGAGSSKSECASALPERVMSMRTIVSRSSRRSKQSNRSGKSTKSAAEGEASMSLASRVESAPFLGLEPQWKRRAPNYGVAHKWNLYVPRSLCLVPADEGGKKDGAAGQAAGSTDTEPGPGEADGRRSPTTAAAATAGIPAVNALLAPEAEPPPKRRPKWASRTAVFEEADPARLRQYAAARRRRDAKRQAREEQRAKEERAAQAAIRDHALTAKEIQLVQQRLQEGAAKREKERQAERLDDLPRAIYDVVSRYLCDPHGAPPVGYLQNIAKIAKTANFAAFHFNCIVGDLREAYFFSSTAKERVVYALAPGEYALTACPWLNPDWPKMTEAKHKLAQLLERDEHPQEYVEELFQILADTRRYPLASLPNTGVGPELEQELSAMFVSSPKLPQYATRSSTVIMVDDQRVRHFHREFVPTQRTGRRPLRAAAASPSLARQSSAGSIASCGSRKSATGMRRGQSLRLVSVGRPVDDTDSDTEEEGDEGLPPGQRTDESDYDPDDLQGPSIADPLKPHKTVVHVIRLFSDEPTPTPSTGAAVAGEEGGLKPSRSMRRSVRPATAANPVQAVRNLRKVSMAGNPDDPGRPLS